MSYKKKTSVSRVAKKDKNTKEINYRLKRTALIASLVGVVGGISFLSSGITGGTILEATGPATSFLGFGLLIAGLLCSFFLMKSRK